MSPGHLVTLSLSLNQTLSTPRYNPPLHLIALLTAAATFPLIFMGGLVTSHGAGMSVPDWPNSYGYNMFLFPPNQWVGGILYEHTHRLMGTVVGFCSIVLALFAWGPARHETPRRWLGRCAAALFLLAVLAALAPLTYHNNQALTTNLRHTAVGLFANALICGAAFLARDHDERRWVRWLCTGVLGAVIFQGVLGGLRVVLVELDLAVVHACFAQAFFCLAALSAVVTSRWWVDAEDRSAESSGRKLFRLAAVAVFSVYLQLVIGALMRHYGAGLAIPDLPMAFGKVVPPVTAEGMRLANDWRVWHAGLPATATLGQVWLHFAHRLGAVIVTVHVIAAAGYALRKHRVPGLTAPAAAMLVLLAAQVTLGVLTVLMRKPADVASSHVAVGALLLVTTFVLAARAARVYRVTPRARPAPAKGFDAPPAEPGGGLRVVGV